MKLKSIKLQSCGIKIMWQPFQVQVRSSLCCCMGYVIIIIVIIIIILIIIIIIIINCNFVVTRWQWLFYMYTKYEIGYY